MANQTSFEIPGPSGTTTSFTLDTGDVLYVLGANGTGKSSLISRLFSHHARNARRISAHRQTWLDSKGLNLTAAGREQLGEQLRTQDAQPQARYIEWNASARAGASLFDLVDAETTLNRKITDLVRAKKFAEAEKQADAPSPLRVINELLQLSNIPVELKIAESQKILAYKHGGLGYNIAELSDGERNALLIAADILTAKENSLILVDEPERHLHRSIISPLLRLLFAKRKDCTFIISTHEPMLPADTPNAATLLVRSCVYSDGYALEWVADFLPSGALLDDQLKADIIGSRRKILFVEGNRQSLDLPLYSLIFPDVSVIPKEGCKEVELAVRGLRSSQDIHWVSAWGIVDQDQRPPDDVARLRAAKVWALSHCSVEALYYHPCILGRMAERQVALIGGDANELKSSALSAALDAVQAQRAHLTTSAVLTAARALIFDMLPTRDDIQSNPSLTASIDVAGLRSAEEAQFDAFLSARDWDGLLTRYPIRQSRAFSRIVNGLEFKDRHTYESGVLTLLQSDETALAEIRNLLGDLYAEVMG